MHGRGHYDLCPLCSWEDDGQDDPHADEVWGGPNGDLSLAEARRNFRDHLTMSRAEDTRCEDSPTEVQAKRAIIGAFDRLSAQPSTPEVERLWATVEENERVAELQRRIQEYEQRGPKGDRVNNRHDRRLASLYAALAALRINQEEPELRLLHRWMDSWAGLGLVVGLLAEDLVRLGHSVWRRRSVFSRAGFCAPRKYETALVDVLSSAWTMACSAASSLSAAWDRRSATRPVPNRLTSARQYVAATAPATAPNKKPSII